MSTVAVVTGASTGIGHATAEALLRLGWRVIGVSLDEERSRLAYERLRPVADEACIKELGEVAEGMRGHDTPGWGVSSSFRLRWTC